MLVLAATSLCALVSSGCYGVTIAPGHRGLFFDPDNGGLQREVLASGYHRVGWRGHIEDFKVTYSTHAEAVRARSQDDVLVDVRVAVRYRPIVAELYELDTEVGSTYYDAVVAPELRSTVRGVFSHHVYVDLQKQDEKLEDEVESDLRRRTRGTHVEISAITLESVAYAETQEAHHDTPTQMMTPLP